MTQRPQLHALAKQIQQYQLERNLSDVALCRKISQLGSTKTYKRILDDDDQLDQLNLEKQLTNYQSAVAFIEALRTDELPPEPEYTTFTNIVDSKSAVARAIRETSIARLVVIEGENGTGKDAVKNALIKDYPEMAAVAQANPLWRDNSDNSRAVKIMLAALIKALTIRRRGQDGEKWTMPITTDGMLDLLKEELNRKKTILLINECHHLGPAGLNLLKDLINDTSVVIVIFCVPKLLSRLVSVNYEEAAQLFGNRLCERVTLPSPPADEIAELFEKRAIKFESKICENYAATLLAGEAPQFGNWRYIVQVAREVRIRANGQHVIQKQFDSAIEIARNRRINQSKKS